MDREAVGGIGFSTGWILVVALTPDAPAVPAEGGIGALEEGGGGRAMPPPSNGCRPLQPPLSHIIAPENSWQESGCKIIFKLLQ